MKAAVLKTALLASTTPSDEAKLKASEAAAGVSGTMATAGRMMQEFMMGGTALHAALRDGLVVGRLHQRLEEVEDARVRVEEAAHARAYPFILQESARLRPLDWRQHRLALVLETFGGGGEVAVGLAARVLREGSWSRYARAAAAAALRRLLLAHSSALRARDPH